MTLSTSQPEIWFLTGSQGLYGEDILAQVADQSRRVSDALAAAADIPASVVAKPVLTDAGAIRTVMLAANADDACVGIIAWMHTFSPAKMWISGLDALRKPLLHLHTQANVDLPWADIDMDFMNLNQAAHGDREFGFIQTRLGVARKTVTGHVSDPSVGAADRRVDSGRGGRGCPVPPAIGAVRRQHAQCRGDRGRQGRGRAAIRRLGQHLRGQRSGRVRRRRPRHRDRRAGREVPRLLYGRRRSCNPGKELGTIPCGTPLASSWSSAASSSTAASPRSPPTSRISAGSGSCLASRSSG